MVLTSPHHFNIQAYMTVAHVRAEVAYLVFECSHDFCHSGL